MTKVTSPGKGATRSDSNGLCREQHAELYAREDDGTVAVYACRGGGTLRIATATVRRLKNGTMGLVEWRIEPGFEHTATTENGSTVHRLARAPDA